MSTSALAASASDEAASSWWAAVVARSPRAQLRVDHRTSDGGWAHSYDQQRRLSSGEPDGPYAVYLADSGGGFHLLCFDLDGPAAAVAADAALLRTWLADAGLTGIEAASGMGGHRHIWLTLITPAAPDLVAELARSAKSQLPTLDVSALLNPRTGCVRPPGAPHRSGARAVVVAPDEDEARRLWVGGQDVARLEILADLVVAEAPRTAAVSTSISRAIATDDNGALHLVGEARRLHPDGHDAAHRPLQAREDASARLWRVLCHAAIAHWHLDTVKSELAPLPGCEHVRTVTTDKRRRVRREAGAAERILHRQWTRAVQHVAALPRSTTIGGDPEYVARADAVAVDAQTLLTRADTSPGYWTAHPLGRRILDAHVQVHLHATQPVIAVSCRRLAEIAGCSAPTASRIRRRLATDGWLIPVDDADGPHASTWAITASAETPPDLSTAGSATRDTQAVPPPVGGGLHGSTDLRDALLATVRRRLALTAHPVFSPRRAGGLGAAAGNLFALLVQERVTSMLDLARATHHSPDTVIKLCDELATHGLACHTAEGWSASRPDLLRHLDRLAVDTNVDTIPWQRRRRHTEEQLMWRWWCDERAWMLLPRAVKYRTRPPSEGQIALLPGAISGLTVRGRLGPMPRDYRGRINWAAARTHIHQRREPTTTAAAA